MKSRVMRKLFFGDLLIFLLLLLFQLGFQTFLFEPFLVSEQSKRLTQDLNALQSAIVDGNAELARQRIDEGMDRGIVMVAEDQQYHQVFGQPIYQYQQCFTLEDQSGKSYTIVEDYLDSIPLQTIELGDKLSVAGYLVDDNQSLVMPSKVYRPKDGIVLGAGTILFVEPSEETTGLKPLHAFACATTNTANAPSNIVTALEAPLMATADQPGGGGATTVGVEASIANNVDSVAPMRAQSKEISAMITNIPPEADRSALSSIAPGALDDETTSSKGFVLHVPDDVSSVFNGAKQSGIPIDDYNDSALRTARILIINSSDRNGDSFPISITGQVTEKNSIGNQDLVVQQGLINEELKCLSSSSTLVAATDSYTLSSQMTTGRYFLRVVRIAEQNMTLIGSISLYSIKDMNSMMNAFHVLMFITELILLAFAIYFFSRIIAKPLEDMNDVALRIAHQDFECKVNITTRDEIGMLGQSINTISTNLEHRITEINAINDQLQMDYERQVELQKRYRELSATFSHELKTPLTIMRGCIDNIQKHQQPR